MYIACVQAGITSAIGSSGGRIVYIVSDTYYKPDGKSDSVYPEEVKLDLLCCAVPIVEY